MDLNGFVTATIRQRTRVFIVILILGTVPAAIHIYIRDRQEILPRPELREKLTPPVIPLPRNTRRQAIMNIACMNQKKKRIPSPIYSSPVEANLYIEPKHNIFYCPVQKAGSSFWMRTLAVMNSDEYTNPYELLLQHHTLMYHTSWKRVVSPEERKKVLNSAFSFLFVREPYGRIFSAYIDKIYYPNKIYWPEFTKDIAQSVRQNKKTHGYDITFAEAVRYVVKKFDKDPHNMDIHFKPMHKLCNPCNVYYKFIGKLETFYDDVSYLLESWKSKYVEFNLKFDDFEKESDLDDITRHVNMLFYVLDTFKFRAEMTKYKILLRGWSDLHIRGFVSKEVPMPFSDYQVPSVTREMYLAAAEGALAKSVDREVVKRQREEAMLQAYRTVPIDVLKNLRRVLQIDCQLFDYNCSPDSIFNRSNKLDVTHVYMKGV